MSVEQFEPVLAAARTGAEWAIAALYRQHNPRLLRYLRAQAGDDAQDIASETWMDAARGLKAFDGDEDGFRGWLFTIARRRLIDHRRRQGRRSGEADATGAARSAEDAAFAGGLGDEAARRILAALPPELAEIVLLRVVADLDVERVAQITGRKPGTVRVMQHRALRRLARDFPGEL